VASDLSNADAAKQGLFYHRFRAGDVRNSRRSFLRLLHASLCAWEPLRKLTKAPPDNASEGENLLNDVKARLAMVGEIPAPTPRTSQPRFLIFADGLDELAPIDADFPALVKDLALPGVLWVVAGRAEHGLGSAFEAAGCESVFGTQGLPMMSASDIREMLETGLGNARYALLRCDLETEGGIRNAFVERVIGQAEGLPLYIYLLLEDLRQGHLTVHDESKLPHGLVAYYDELMNRVGLSTVKHDLSLAVCLLAKAAEPLNAASLALRAASGVAAVWRLRRGDRIERALRSGRGLLRLAPTSDGTDGWTLYHQSFREYVAGRPADLERGISSAPPATALADLVKEAEDRLVQAADWWAELPRGNLRNHLFRQGVGYALTWGGSDGVEAVWRRLTDFAYLMARTEALRLAGIPGLTQDYTAALRSVASEGRQELARSPGPTSDDLLTWERFFRSTAHVIGRADTIWPAERIMLQCGCDHADSSPITRAAEAWIASHSIPWRWVSA
jgi:hypothetical protein